MDITSRASLGKKSTLFLATVLILVSIGFGFLFWTRFLNSPQAQSNKSPGGVFCTQEAKQCPDGSYVGRTGPNCEFLCPSEASCEGGECPTKGAFQTSTPPLGYTLDSYKVEKVLDKSCTENSQCETPGEYLLQSRCPFTSLCLENKCTVVCLDFVEDGWKRTADEKSGISFKYPEQLTTKYISTVDWPPQVQIVNEKFSCTQVGKETDRAGKTEKRVVSGSDAKERTYCVTTKSEGAAGSVYTQYAYAFPYGEKTIIFTFSLKSVQCANYGDPDMGSCMKESSSFDLDGVVDRMVQSIVYKAM